MQKNALLGVLAVLIVLLIGKVVFFSAPSTAKIAQMQSAYNQIGGYKLGEAIGKKFTPKKVLVILPGDMTAPENQGAAEMLAGLKEASTAAGFSLVETCPKAKSDNKPLPGDEIPVVPLRSSGEWDKVFSQDGKDCTVVITFLPLPADAEGNLLPPANIDKMKVVTIGDPGAAKSIADMSLIINPTWTNSYPSPAKRDKAFETVWLLQSK